MANRRTMKLSLNSGNVNDLIKELNAYRDSLSDKAEQLVEGLAKVGIPVIQSNMTTEGDSDPSCSITYHTSRSGTYARCTLTANGEDLLFIEFGAGVHYNGSVGQSPNPKGEEMGYTIGSYGEGQGANDYWHYMDDDGKWHTSHGTKASMPMYKASLEIFEKVQTVAREVFG